MTDLRREPYGFSLTEGGPFYHLMIRFHVASGPWHILWPAVITWFPLVIATVIRVIAGQSFDSTVTDLTVHARLLIAVPVMMFAERLLDGQCRGAIGTLARGGYADRSALERILAHAERLRDSGWAELVILVVVVIDSQLVMWDVIETFHGGGAEGPWRFNSLWYALVGVPLMQFVMLRWFWRWLIWTDIMWRIARLPLAALATHPDRAAGLSPFTWPLRGFAIFVFAVSSVAGGAWGTQLIAGRTTLPELFPGMLAFALVATVVGCGPLLAFTGHIYRARKFALADYSDFALVYNRRFHTKWIEHASSAGDPLGDPDIQSWNDLGGGYQRIVDTKIIPIGPRKVIEIWLAALLPMLPLVLGMTTVEQLLKRIFSALLGGLPI